MFKIDPGLYIKLIKQGWSVTLRYGNSYYITNPDDEEETYTFKSNNQILWFLRGFESGLSKTEETEEQPTDQQQEEEINADE